MDTAESLKLNRKLLEEKLLGTELANYNPEVLNYPEKIIQFGEGNFLRAFVDWMVHQVNKEGLFKGRVVAVQPIAQGRVANLNQQDGLYTQILRGMQKGQIVDRREIIPVISRGLNAYTEWEEVLKCAENPEIEYIVSNTTEAGISYNAKDKLTDNPSVSFPAKITAYLYRRYQHFQGAPDKGMILLPCELIDRNGDNLKRIVLRLAAEWGLAEAFITWLKTSNQFLNTLVDRIVTGYPFKEADKLQQELGYKDQNLNTGEIFHLWVIEGDTMLQERLPFAKAGLNVKWVKDMTPYRTRKVRILNGVHTSAVAVAYLSNIELVRDAVHDGRVGKFMHDVVFEEIIPTLDLDAKELQGFAKDVLERFNNPFIDHKWFDISLNSTSKFQARVLPSLKQYVAKTGHLPKRLTFSLAALIAFYHGTEIRNNRLVGNRASQEYLIQDDLVNLEFFQDMWTRYQKGELSLVQLTTNSLAKLCPEELEEYPELVPGVARDLKLILREGMLPSLEKVS